MMETLLRIVAVFLLVLANGFFVTSEFAIVSVRRMQVASLAEGGDRAAQRLLSFKDNLGAYISATQLGVTLASLALALTGPATAAAAEKVELAVDASKPGAKIDRNIFGQFAEHLGHGIYEGIWVGRNSEIPNTRGIRNDVVAALKAIKVPNVRWPGGCFADEYHWRKGIGSPRPATLIKP